MEGQEQEKSRSAASAFDDSTNTAFNNVFSHLPDGEEEDAPETDGDSEARDRGEGAGEADEGEENPDSEASGRDDSGDQAGEAEGAAGDEAAAESGDEGEAEQESEAQDALKEPPQSWAADKRHLWTRMGKESRAYVVEREQQLQAQMNRVQNEANQVIRPVKEVLEHVEPYRRQWGMAGKTVPQKLVEAVELLNYLEDPNTDKGEIAIRFQQQSGRSWEQLAGQAAEPASQDDVLNKRIDTLESELKSERERKAQEQQQAVQGYWQREFEKFRGTQNLTGGKKYPQADNPHFATVLGSLVQQKISSVPGMSPQEALLQAYNEAGGQIVNGLPTRSTTQTNKQERLRTAAKTGYAKNGNSGAPTRHGTFEAAAEASGAFDHLPDD